MQIRLANINDIPYVVAIHMERFSHFFLTSLGSSFLKTYYSSLLIQPGLLLVLEDENQIMGFAAGSYTNQAFYKKIIKQNFWAFFKAGLFLISTRPKSLWRIFSNLFSANNEQMKFSELLSIATVKNVKGYGTLLLQSFEQMIKQNSDDQLATISLTTDLENNEKTISFYKTNGYNVHKTFEGFANRMMYRLTKNI